MDYMALAGTNHLLHRKEKNTKLIVVAFVASGIGLLFLFFLKSYSWYLGITHLVLGPAMVVAAFGKVGRRSFFENWGVCYLMLLLLGGVWNLLNRECQGIAMETGKICVVVLIFVTCVDYLARRKKRAAHCYTVWISHQGKRKKIYAYWDSGNQLMDCYTKEPVHVVSKKCIEEFEKDGPLPYRLVPFCAIGEKQGCLKVATLEEMEILEKEHSIQIRPVVIGVAEDGELDNREYQMILHATALEQKIKGKEG